ncbi:MAG TPA: hypothetical protein VJR58_00685 [Vineibacter sp.]|nr:hypothetical protein [Vineibacter sp.]
MEIPGGETNDLNQAPVAIDLRDATDVRGIWPVDGGTVTLEVSMPTGAGRLIVPVADVQRLVALLLLLAQPLGDTTIGAEGRHVADLSVIPTTSLSVGELPNGETLLAVEVGPSMLGFSLPASAATKLGLSLMLAATSRTADA